MKQFNSIESEVILEKLLDKSGGNIVELRKLRKLQHNILYRIIKSRSAILGKIIIFVKKVIKKITFWYMKPICEQQTAYNQSTADSIESLEEKYIELLNDIKENDNTTKYLVDKVDALEEKIKNF